MRKCKGMGWPKAKSILATLTIPRVCNRARAGAPDVTRRFMGRTSIRECSIETDLRGMMSDERTHFGSLSSAFGRCPARSKSKREFQPCARHPASRVTLSIFVGCFSLTAAEIDETKLPPPANVEVDFVRDIKPIFEKS